MLSRSKKLYYYLKPIIPHFLIYLMRSSHHRRLFKMWSARWPIDPDFKMGKNGKLQWPDEKDFCLVLTHDVETEIGQDKALELANLEFQLGFKAAYYFIPERYKNREGVKQELRQMGFEIGVHGLNHDGKLYFSKKIFRERVKRINQYLASWGAVGFRAPAMHHRLDWLHELDILYDASTFDHDPFEPQAQGLHKIFPTVIFEQKNGGGYVELPYTLPQDSTLFLFLGQKNTDLWKKKLDWIVERGGMALLIVHPDYINFQNSEAHYYQYPIRYYEEFLEYVIKNYQGKYYNPLPMDLAAYVKANWTNQKHIEGHATSN